MTFQTFNAGELAKKALMGGSITAGAMVAYELLEIAKREPRLLESVVSWGPLFAIAIAGMLLVDRRMGTGVEALRENSAAQQKLADAVQQIAHKDDEREREREIVMGHLARNSSTILERLGAIEQKLEMKAKAHGHSAG